MDITIRANDRWRFLELFAQRQRELPRPLGQLGIGFVEPYMTGPDANGDVTFFQVPSDFLAPLEGSGMSYRVN